MTLFHGLGHVASGRLRSQPGMVLLTPTSIAHSGTSASIGANGQVTFTAVTSLSLNGVFSADFDNYVVFIEAGMSNASSANMQMRLRSNGSDNSTANSYTLQYIQANGSTIDAGRGTYNLAPIGTWAGNTLRNGFCVSVYGPFLSQPTALRSVTMSSFNSATIEDTAGTHNQSTSYDGATFSLSSFNMTGKLAVYGIKG